MSLSELSPIHVAKDEERQSPARSFIILSPWICGKQLHRSVICGAHDFQCVWAVDIVLAVAECRIVLPICLGCLRAHPKERLPVAPPCLKFVKIVNPVEPMS